MTGPWLTDAEQEAWRGMLRMSARLSAALGHDLAEHSELSSADYAVLVYLTDEPSGRLRAYELGEELGWEKSRVSHQVDRMVHRGLVTRERCPSDQRGLFVVLTADGRRALEAAAPAHVAAVRRLFVDRCTPEQLATLVDVSRAVLDALSEEAPTPPAPDGRGGRTPPDRRRATPPADRS